MKQRCLDRNRPAYPAYGGRGIRISQKWLSFLGFLEDMGPRPAGSSLERKNNDRGYCKSNCKWADRFEQARNHRRHVRFTANGTTKCVGQWAHETGLGYTTIKWRMERGWPVEKVLSKDTSHGKYQRSKTRCPAGHTYTSKNTYISPNGNRKCRTCNRIRAQKLRDRVKSLEAKP